MTSSSTSRSPQVSAFWAGGFRSLPAALDQMARDQPDQTSFTFLRDGERRAADFTWRALNRAVTNRAELLITSELTGCRALLMYEPGLEFVATFIACLRAGVIAVPVPVPRRSSAVERVRVVAADAGTDVVLTDTETQFALPGQGLSGLRLVRSDQTVHARPRLPSAPAPDDTALLQYTSGSTSRPKGVIVTHSNLWHQAREIDELWPTQPGDPTVSWLPMFHDMGLMFGLILSVFRGSPTTLFAPESFVRRPIRWLQALSDTHAVTSIAPNFAYQHCLHDGTAEERTQLDLSSWRYAINGAEPVSAETMRAFLDTFSGVGLQPGSVVAGYGLAEATLKVAGTSRGPSQARILSAQQLRAGYAVPARSGEQVVVKVECGTSSPGTEIRIIDPGTAVPLADGTVGEIWVSGPCVGAGYWNRPEETEQIFQARVAGETTGSTYLKTGDLGFVEDGNLFVTGRHKDLLIFHGQNHYPQDIEGTATSALPLPGRSAACAFSTADERGEHLVVAVELDPALLADEVDREAIATLVWQQHGVAPAAVVFVRRGQLAKTTSGKLRRSAVAQAYLDGNLKIVSGSGAVAEPEAASAQRELNELLEWLDDWAVRRVDALLMDERRSLQPHVVLDLARRGVLGMQVPRAKGGLGLDNSGMLRVIERLASVDLGLATFVCDNNVLGVRPVLRYAKADVRERLLPVLARGQALTAFALSEPGAGSFVPAIATTATSTGHGSWRLDGVKAWSGNAAGSSTIITFAQAYDDEGRSLGMTAFLVDTDAPGVRLGEEELTMGMRSMVHNTIFLDGVRVDADHILGEVGRGYDVANDAMTQARLMIGGLSIGAMRRCLGIATGYARHRPISTGLMIDNPVVRETLSEAVAATRAVESLVHGTARLFETGQTTDEFVPLVLKVVCPELLWDVVDDCVQLLGGRGYIETSDLPRFLRDSRVLRIFEGPTESLRMHLGSLVLDRQAALRDLIENHFHDPESASALSAMIGEVVGAFERWSFQDAVEATRMLQDRLGELVAAGLVDVVVRRTIALADDEDDVRGWSARRLHRAHDYAIARPMVLTADRLLKTTTADVARAHQLTRRQAGVRLIADPLVAGHDRTPGEVSPKVSAEESSGDDTSWQEWLIRWVAERAGLNASDIDPSSSLQRFGIDSVSIAALVGDIDDNHDVDIPATLVWEHPTIDALAREIAARATRTVRNGGKT